MALRGKRSSSFFQCRRKKFSTLVDMLDNGQDQTIGFGHFWLCLGEPWSMIWYIWSKIFSSFWSTFVSSLFNSTIFNDWIITQRTPIMFSLWRTKFPIRYCQYLPILIRFSSPEKYVSLYLHYFSLNNFYQKIFQRDLFCTWISLMTPFTL